MPASTCMSASQVRYACCVEARSFGNICMSVMVPSPLPCRFDCMHDEDFCSDVMNVHRTPSLRLYKDGKVGCIQCMQSFTAPPQPPAPPRPPPSPRHALGDSHLGRRAACSIIFTCDSLAMHLQHLQVPETLSRDWLASHTVLSCCVWCCRSLCTTRQRSTTLNSCYPS